MRVRSQPGSFALLFAAANTSVNTTRLPDDGGQQDEEDGELQGGHLAQVRAGSNIDSHHMLLFTFYGYMFLSIPPDDGGHQDEEDGEGQGGQNAGEEGAGDGDAVHKAAAQRAQQGGAARSAGAAGEGTRGRRSAHSRSGARANRWK